MTVQLEKPEQAVWFPGDSLISPNGPWQRGTAGAQRYGTEFLFFTFQVDSFYQFIHKSTAVSVMITHVAVGSEMRLHKSCPEL